jgi:cobalt-zinc-cadmium efflux system outer membrane protein
MRTIILRIGLSCLSLFFFHAFAEEGRVHSLSMDEAVDMALQRNPGLKVAEKEIDAASARVIQARLFPNPTLFLETEDGDADSLGFGEEYKSIIGLSQALPLGGKIKARKEMARGEEDLAMLGYEFKLLEIIAETKKAFVKIVANQELARIAGNNLEIARKLFDAAKSRVEALAAPETEQIKAEIEQSQAQVKLRNAKIDLYNSEQQLHAQLGNVDIQVSAYKGSLRDDFPRLNSEKMEAAVLPSYPELLKVKKLEEISKARLQLARSKKYPDIEIGVGAGKERGFIENNNTIEWAIQIPLPLFDRNQGEIMESEILMVKARKEYEDALNRVKLQIKQTLSSFDILLEQVRTYKKKVLPQAEKSLALMLEGYNVGKFTYIELLDSQRTLTETRETYIHMLQELNSAAIEIERLAGTSIDKLS